MKLTVAILFSLLLLASPLSAETVEVRSGDHDDFSRLLLRFPASEEWRFGKTPDGYEFHTAREDVSYDLDQVYSLISRNRIKSVRDLGGGRLALDVSCDCHADAFEIRQGMIVLDIKDGPAPYSKSPFETAIHEVRLPHLEGSAVNDTSTFSSRTGVTLPLQSYEPTPAFSVLSRLPGKLPTTSLDGAAVPSAVANSIGPRQVAELDARSTRIIDEQALFQDVARGASQGMVTVTERLNPIAEELHAEVQDLSLLQEVEFPTVLEIVPADHIVVETAVDRAFDTQMKDSTNAGVHCIKDSVLDLAAWGASEEAKLETNHFQLRSDNSADAKLETELTNLTKYYLYLGFGAEAEAVIRAFPDIIENKDILLAVSRVVDQKPVSNSKLLDAQIECDGLVSFWALLAAKERSTISTENTEAMVQSFLSLPLHLKRHLGPDFAKALSEINHQDAALVVRDALANIMMSPLSIAALDGDLAMLDGNAPAAESSYERIDMASNLEYIDTLISSAEASIAAGGLPTSKTVELLESLAFERREGNDVARLLEVLIRTYSGNNEFDRAFMSLEMARDGGVFDASKLVSLEMDVFSELVSDAEPVEFLKHVLKNISHVTSMKEPVRNAVLERLVKLGVTDPVGVVLKSGPQGLGVEERIIGARSALKENNPMRAIRYLHGVSGDMAPMLLAQAYEMAGKYSIASRNYYAAGLEREAERLAWWAGDLDYKIGFSTEIYSAASALKNQSEDFAEVLNEDSQVTLNTGRTALQTAEGSRRILKNLLEITDFDRP
ncbi:MAG: hypothetical protein CR958_00045 [Rhodobacterales bacterium]|nr:MAG: hypothetical protein CR958_00045 [Rhodobacterales bacterium]